MSGADLTGHVASQVFGLTLSRGSNWKVHSPVGYGRRRPKLMQPMDDAPSLRIPEHSASKRDPTQTATTDYDATTPSTATTTGRCKSNRQWSDTQEIALDQVIDAGAKVLVDQIRSRAPCADSNCVSCDGGTAGLNK
jgi:hypothetical protein